MTEEAPQIPNLLLTPARHSSIRVLVNDMLSHVQPPSAFSTMVLLLIAFTSRRIGHAFIYILPILSLSLIPKRKPGTAKLTSARFPRHAVVINVYSTDGSVTLQAMECSVLMLQEGAI